MSDPDLQTQGGRVLEPALGISHFFGLMPEEMSARSRLTGIELDPLTTGLFSICPSSAVDRKALFCC
jgi:hypothetical protein